MKHSRASTRASCFSITRRAEPAEMKAPSPVRLACDIDFWSRECHRVYMDFFAGEKRSLPRPPLSARPVPFSLQLKQEGAFDRTLYMDVSISSRRP
jgi:hypothetical protein